MQEFKRDSKSKKNRLILLIGSVIGGAVTIAIITILPLDQASLVSSILLASLIVVCSFLSNPSSWWVCVGAISGMIVGIGGIMGSQLAAAKTPLPNERATFVVILAIAGVISGVFLARGVRKPHIPTLKEFTGSLSALTAGIFGVVVTYRFIADGLEQARALSSRLSTSITILIAIVAIPGVIAYLLAEPRKKVATLNQPIPAEHETLV